MENLEDFEIDCDLRQSEAYGNYMRSIGWHVIEITSTKSQAPNKLKIQNSKLKIFIKKLGPVGICKIQRYKGEIDATELEILLKRYHAVRVILEPETAGKALPGYRVNNEPLLGTKTLRVNLKQSEEKLFNSFRKDCRYTLRKFEILNLKFSINEFNNFYKIWRKSGKRLNIWTAPKREFDSLIKCFGDKCFCLTIDDRAGCLVLLVKNTAFFYYAGATKEGTRENLPYLAVWTAMKEAKKRGARCWDFEGIYDARWPTSSWKGFSHFKKSFGGMEIEFPGSFAKWRWPF